MVYEGRGGEARRDAVIPFQTVHAFWKFACPWPIWYRNSKWSRTVPWRTVCCGRVPRRHLRILRIMKFAYSLFMSRIILRLLMSNPSSNFQLGLVRNRRNEIGVRLNFVRRLRNCFPCFGYVTAARPPAVIYLFLVPGRRVCELEDVCRGSSYNECISLYRRAQAVGKGWRAFVRPFVTV